MSIRRSLKFTSLRRLIDNRAQIFYNEYMNYIGSKYSIIDFLHSSIQKTLELHGEEKSPADMVFADLFAGTGTVGAYFREQGFSVIANDIQYYSYVICRHLIEGAGADGVRCAELLSELNALEGREGFIYKNYSYGGTEGQEFRRMYFSDENAKKCDAVRQTIEEWKDGGRISASEYCFLLGSLINSADKYANTASVYGAYLKKLKKSAQKEMVLSPLPFVDGPVGKAYNEDINALAARLSGDILYLDPPYNTRQYCTNYHLLETLARYDEPVIHGKTGLREYSAQKSAFCSRAQVAKAFNDLIKNARFRYIFLSYNNEGLMSSETIEKIMKKYGRYRLYIKEHRRFKADSSRESKADSTVEYLHCLVKDL